MGRILALALCLICSPLVAAAELGVLAPVIVDGQPMMKRDAKNREVPVVTRVASGALYDQLQKEARRQSTGEPSSRRTVPESR